MSKRVVVLIPGAGGQAWYWHRVVPALAARGVEAIAVDLPAGDESAGLAEYAAAALDAAREAAREADRVVVVGQSMGGFVAPQVARELGADELVLVNAMIPQPGERPGEWFAATSQATAMADYAQSQGREPSTEVDPIEHLLDDLPDHIRGVVEDRGEPMQADRPFGDPWPEPEWPDIPTRVVVGAGDRLFPADFQARVAHDRLGLKPQLIEGGHLLALANPEALAEAILAPSTPLR